MRWASETRPDPESEGWLIGDAIEVSEDAEFSGTPFKVKVGDAVYLTGVRKGAPAEIQLVEELFEDAREQSKKKGFIWMQTAAFWRPEKMKIPDEIAWHAKELFPAMRDGETLTCDNSPGKFLELTRVHVSRCDDPAKFEDADHTFFYNKSFDPKACALFALEAPAAVDTGDTPQRPDAAGTPTAANEPAAAAEDGPARKRSRPNEQRDARIAALEAEVSMQREELRSVLMRMRELEASLETLTKAAAGAV